VKSADWSATGATYGLYLLAHRLRSAHAVLDVAIAAEALGFEYLWAGERVFYPGPAPRNTPIDFDPFTVLSYVAGRTSRIRLGTSTVILPYRNPVLLAKAVATLDQLSGGRVTLGVGVGSFEKEYEFLGVPFAQRGAICDEHIYALKEIWTSELPQFRGRFCSFGPLTFSPKPVQKPHPPIWIAGDSQRAMQRAVEFGDAWQPELDLPQMETAARRFFDLAAEKGRLPPPLLTVGSRRLQIADVDAGPERQPLQGSPEQVAADVRRYIELGVRHFVFWVPTGPANVIDQMQRFAERVIPLLQANG
jgi:probable F420-dependent oxidoreductase